MHTTGIILAAGKGTRMNMPFPKVLAEVDGKPLIHWVLHNLFGSGITDVIVVIGFGADLVRKSINDAGFAVRYAVQSEQMGTGHAAKIGLEAVDDGASTVIVTYGDMPFISSETFRHLVAKQHETSAAAVLTTVSFDDPMGPAFGRIVRDIAGKISAIVEQKVCTKDQLAIKECNAGPVAYDRLWLPGALEKINRNPISGEYYLTDLVELAYTEGRLVEAVQVSDVGHAHGVNTIEHLEQAKHIIARR